MQFVCGAGEVALFVVVWQLTILEQAVYWDVVSAV
jgi:hypothetical protein